MSVLFGFRPVSDQLIGLFLIKTSQVKKKKKLLVLTKMTLLEWSAKEPRIEQREVLVEYSTSTSDCRNSITGQPSTFSRMKNEISCLKTTFKDSYQIVSYYRCGKILLRQQAQSVNRSSWLLLLLKKSSLMNCLLRHLK